MLEAQLRSLKSCIPALVSTGRDRAYDDRLTASNWVSAMEKQKAISAAVDRNRRRCETLAATSSDGVI